MNNRTILMNSAMMPAEGHYACRRVDETTFASLLKEAAADRSLLNNIGYPENLAYLKALTGVSLEPNRTAACIVPGDRMLAMRTKYVEKREQRSKSRRIGPRVWEYFVIDYSALTTEAANGPVSLRAEC